jgi:hypothetical protein
MNITRTTTWVTGNTLTAQDLNEEFDNLLNSPSIVNADVSASAAIAYSKLSLTNSILNADINSSAAIALSKLATGALPTGITIASANIVNDSIVNADVNSAAAIAYSKLNLSDSILNADINSSAAIAYSKLALTDSIVNADISSSAAIALSKLATGALPTGITIASANIVNGTIVNTDVNASAAIAESKIAFDTSNGHSHNGVDSKKITINRAFTWYIDGTAIIANEVGAKYIAPQDMTVVKIWYKTTSGTCTIRIQKNTTDIDAGNSVSSTLGSTTSISSAAITAGQIISLDISAASSPVGLIVCMECEQ